MANISKEVWVEDLEKLADGTYKRKNHIAKARNGVTFDEHLVEKATLTKLGHVKAETDADGKLILPEVNIASNSQLGIVRPDGQTIVVNEDGVLSSPKLKNTFFYQSGNEYPTVTGRWVLSSNIVNNHHTKEKQADRIYMFNSSYADNTGRITMSTIRKISMDNISKLKLAMTSDRTASSQKGMIYFGLKEDISDISNDSFVARFTSGANDNITMDDTIELDVSSLSGEYYLEVRLRVYKNYSARAYIYSIWGESE